MKKNKLITLLLVLGCMTLSSCAVQDIFEGLLPPKPPQGETSDLESSNDKTQEAETFSVAFYIDKYHFIIKKVNKYDCVERPTDPYKKHYRFINWFEHQAHTPFDFNTKITRDIDLYAAFEPDPNQDDDSTSTSIVTLNANGGKLDQVSNIVNKNCYYTLPVPTDKANFAGYYYNDTPMTNKNGESLTTFKFEEREVTFDARYFVDNTHKIKTPISIKVSTQNRENHKAIFDKAYENLKKKEPHIYLDYVDNVRTQEIYFQDNEGINRNLNVFYGYTNTLKGFYDNHYLLNFNDMPEFKKESQDYLPHVLNQYKDLQDDVRFMIPYNLCSNIMILNKKLFDKVHLPSYPVIDETIFDYMDIDQFHHKFLKELNDFENQYHLLNNNADVPSSLLLVDDPLVYYSGLVHSKSPMFIQKDDGNYKTDLENESTINLIKEIKSLKDQNILNTFDSKLISNPFANNNAYLLTTSTNYFQNRFEPNIDLIIANNPIGLRYNNGKWLGAFNSPDKDINYASMLFALELSSSEAEKVSFDYLYCPIPHHMKTIQSNEYLNYIQRPSTDQLDKGYKQIQINAERINYDISAFPTSSFSFNVRRGFVNVLQSYLNDCIPTDEELIEMLKGLQIY